MSQIDFWDEKRKKENAITFGWYRYPSIATQKTKKEVEAEYNEAKKKAFARIVKKK